MWSIGHIFLQEDLRVLFFCINSCKPTEDNNALPY
jgi:ribosomal protein L24E